MSEPTAAQDPTSPSTAGALLRAARQAQGLHVAALATQLKVSPRKLEALEADRHDELQGPTYVRALAQAAARALKIDPAPVLALLPEVNRQTLDRVSAGLNAPFREHGARRELLELSTAGKAVAALVAVLLLGAVALWWLPAGFGMSAAVSAASAPAVEAAASEPPVAVSPSAVASVPALGASAASAPARVASAVAAEPEQRPAAVEPARLLQVRVKAESWVDVTDGSGQSLLSRTLQPGETVDLDGALPLRVKVGNASGTELSFRGQVLDLGPQTRDNVARLELK